jgi:hypothetical protein
MESYSKKTGKKFTGKFAETAVKIGIASENLEGKKQEETPAKPSKVAKPAKVDKPAKVKTKKDKTIVEPKQVNVPSKSKANKDDKTIMVSDQVKGMVSSEPKNTTKIPKNISKAKITTKVKK